MIVEKTTHERWLSNTWLVGDRPGGHAVIVDAGGPVEPIVASIERDDLTLTHVLCTHHHWDHVANAAEYRTKYDVPVCGHPAERELYQVELDEEIEHDHVTVSGDLRVRAVHIPGHTTGQLAFTIGSERVFTGDTLFRRSVGGTRGPGHATFEDLRRSIMDVLMKLPKEMVVHPGHVDETTIGEEWEENPFIRAWRGLDPPDDRRCTAFGEPATLLLQARDYDGGTKCWVRFDEGNVLDLVPGSRLQLT